MVFSRNWMLPVIVLDAMETSSAKSKRSSLVAGPMIWYAFAGLSILISLYLFLTAAEAAVGMQQQAIAIFIGLWAPMFAILGLRAELFSVRDELMKKPRR